MEAAYSSESLAPMCQRTKSYIRNNRIFKYERCNTFKSHVMNNEYQILWKAKVMILFEALSSHLFTGSSLAKVPETSLMMAKI